MAWVIDGNNLLGAMGVDRHSIEAKRELTRLLAAFARVRKTRVTCYFDGPEPSSFGRHLGATTIVFSGGRTADELIAERVKSGKGWNVVTADRQLGMRVGGRNVTVVEPAQFVRQLQSLERETEGQADEDWMAYFSDPKNRERF